MTNLEIVVNPDGTVDKVTIVRTSGHQPYDVAAIDVAYSAAPYPPTPPEIRSGNGKVYVHWRFHRDRRQCATTGVDYFILTGASARNDGGPFVPTRDAGPSQPVVHSKGLAAMTVAVAVANTRGWLDYDAPVARYWPEFAQNGKGAITVRQLLGRTCRS
jgi:TonB family protein